MNWYYVIALFTMLPLHGFVGRVSHDWRSHKAHAAFERGDVDQAEELYLMALEQAPEQNLHQEQAQYNLGRTSFERGELDSASAYFQAAAQSSDVQLKEQALFNWGYALFKQKKLQESLEQFEEVVKLNADNQMAHHNIELIKKMLEQQEQQDQNKDQQQDQDQEQQDNSDGGGGGSDSENQEGEGKEQEGDSSDMQGDEGQKDQQQQERDEGRDKDERQPEQDQGMNKRDRPDQGLDDQQTDEQQKQDAQHESTPEKTEQPQKQSAMQRAEWEDSLKDSPELVALLQEQEEQDAQKGKDMIKHAISQEMPDYDGQNCW